jgi:hypothetical protein
MNWPPKRWKRNHETLPAVEEFGVSRRFESDLPPCEDSNFDVTNLKSCSRRGTGSNRRAVRACTARLMAPGAAGRATAARRGAPRRRDGIERRDAVEAVGPR